MSGFSIKNKQMLKDERKRHTGPRFLYKVIGALRTKTIATATKKIKAKMIDGKTVLRG